MKSFIIALVLAATTSAKSVVLAEPELKSTGWDVPGDRLYGLCEGDCDETHECEKGLVCFTRGAAHTGSAQQAYSNNPFQTIPGCTGKGLEDMDYCISKPQLKVFQDNKGEYMGAEWYGKWKAEHDARAAAKAKAAQDAHDKKMADAKAAADKKAADAKAAHEKKMAAQKAAADKKAADVKAAHEKKMKAIKARKAANAKKEKARLAKLAEEKAKLAALAAERAILKASQPAPAPVAAAPCNTCGTAPQITMKSTTVVVKHADW